MSTQLGQIAKKAKLDRKATVYFVGAPADAGIPQGDLGNDEPARQQVVSMGRAPNSLPARWRSGLRKSATAEGRHVPGATGQTGRNTQRAGQERHATVGNSHCRGPAAAASGRAHTRGCVRSRLPRLQFRFSTGPQPSPRACRPFVRKS